jgi:glutathione synthase/RimK-type ligase-like ATP-grasp enzyme
MAYIMYRNEFGVYISKEIAKISETGIKAFKNTDKLPADDDFLFRWGTTSNAPGHERKVINEAKAIHETADKRTFRAKMAKEGLAPRTWLTLEEWASDFREEKPGVMGPYLPVIIRKAKHERSEGLVLCTTFPQVCKTAEELGKGNYYISEYIEKDREFRVFVCQGKIAWIIEKFPENKKEVSWGCTNDEDESYFEYVAWSEWPLDVAENAIRSFNLSNLHFGAVDIISKKGKAYALEINTGPEVTPYYIKCIAKCFDYIVKNKSGKRMPTEEADFKDWKKLIHPAIGG